MKVWDLGQRRLSVLACTMTLLCFMGRTWVRNTDWHDIETLFRSAVAAYPKSAKAHQGLGEALKKRGDCIGALDEYALALARNGIKVNKLQAYKFSVVGGIYFVHCR